MTPNTVRFFVVCTQGRSPNLAGVYNIPCTREEIASLQTHDLSERLLRLFPNARATKVFVDQNGYVIDA